MRLRTLTALVPALVAAIALFPSAPETPAETPSSAAAPSQSAPQEMPKPGAMHAWLKSHAGVWEVSSKMRMAPGAPWMESKGTETVKSICGGFWISSVQRGNMMGMPFEGRMQLGYDTYKKKFVGTWIDNFGSYQTILEGTLSKDKKVLTLNSKMLDPMSGKMMDVRMTTTYESADKSRFQMFMPAPGGKEFMTMEQTSVRKKATSRK